MIPLPNPHPPVPEPIAPRPPLPVPRGLVVLTVAILLAATMATPARAVFTDAEKAQVGVLLAQIEAAATVDPLAMKDLAHAVRQLLRAADGATVAGAQGYVQDAIAKLVAGSAIGTSLAGLDWSLPYAAPFGSSYPGVVGLVGDWATSARAATGVLIYLAEDAHPTALAAVPRVTAALRLLAELDGAPTTAAVLDAQCWLLTETALALKASGEERGLVQFSRAWADVDRTAAALGIHTSVPGLTLECRVR